MKGIVLYDKLRFLTMRDLAQQSLRVKRERLTGSKVRVIRIGIIVAVIVGSVLFANYGFTIPVIGGGDIVLRDAQHDLEPVDVVEGPVSVEGGINLASEKAAFKNVSNIRASASAERVYGDGSFTMTVSATLKVVQGHRVQVWLTDGEKVADAGFMENSGDTWSTVFRDKDRGYSDMNGIWITDELTTEDNKPEAHILKGTF